MTNARRQGPGSRGEYAKTTARKQAIVDAATTVFSQRGYHGGSLRDVAKEVGVSLAGIVHHFPSKSDLLEEVLAVADERARITLDLADATGEAFVPWILETVRANMERPEMLRMLAIVASEASAPDHPAHAWFVHRYDTVTGLFAEHIARDQAGGLITADVPPLALAQTLIALWDGLQLQWLLDRDIDIVGLMKVAMERALAIAQPPARV